MEIENCSPHSEANRYPQLCEMVSYWCWTNEGEGCIHKVQSIDKSRDSIADIIQKNLLHVFLQFGNSVFIRCDLI